MLYNNTIVLAFMKGTQTMSVDIFAGNSHNECVVALWVDQERRYYTLTLGYDSDTHELTVAKVEKTTIDGTGTQTETVDPVAGYNEVVNLCHNEGVNLPQVLSSKTVDWNYYPVVNSIFAGAMYKQSENVWVGITIFEQDDITLVNEGGVYLFYRKGELSLVLPNDAVGVNGENLHDRLTNELKQL